MSQPKSFELAIAAKQTDKIFEKIKKYLDASPDELTQKFQLLGSDLVSQEEAEDDPNSIIKTYKNDATEVYSRDGTILRTYTDQTMVLVDENKNITLVSRQIFPDIDLIEFSYYFVHLLEEYIVYCSLQHCFVDMAVDADADH